MNRTCALVALGTAASLGCSGGEGATPVTVSDSAGVRLVVNRAPLHRGAPVSLGEVLLDVGGRDSELGAVAGVVRLDDGRVVVADELASEVLFFGADGGLLRRVGGRGDGPGEYRLITGLGAAGGDSVWVYDFGNARMTLLGPEGALTRSFALRPALSSAQPLGRLPGGDFLMAEAWSSARVEESGALGLSREPVAYVRYRPDGTLRDTLGLFPGREVILEEESGRMTMGAAPFGRTSSHALGAGGVLVVGDQVDHEIGLYGPDGAPTGVVRWSGGDLRITESEVAEWKERQVESVAPDRRAATRAYLEGVPVPPRRPAYGRILAAPDGGVWVAAYAHPGRVPARWEIFDREGRWLGTLEVPAGYGPAQLGDDWVLAVVRDELGVERVTVRALRPA